MYNELRADARMTSAAPQQQQQQQQQQQSSMMTAMLIQQTAANMQSMQQMIMQMNTNPRSMNLTQQNENVEMKDTSVKPEMQID